jgi:hypothetical protein
MKVHKNIYWKGLFKNNKVNGDEKEISETKIFKTPSILIDPETGSDTIKLFDQYLRKYRIGYIVDATQNGYVHKTIVLNEEINESDLKDFNNNRIINRKNHSTGKSMYEFDILYYKIHKAMKSVFNDTPPSVI